jgi:hypothetical protein
MAWKKSPPALVATFGRVGYPAAFVHGNMFAGLFEDSVVLRLDEAAAAKRVGASDFAPMPGRRMTGWVAMGGKHAVDEAALRRWVARAFRHAEALPAKKAKRKAAGVRTRLRRAK